MGKCKVEQKGHQSPLQEDWISWGLRESPTAWHGTTTLIQSVQPGIRWKTFREAKTRVIVQG
jgi:hypothetical protein